MINKEIFRIWAPIGVKWVDWVRPVPFISINENSKIYDIENFEIANINYLADFQKDTAIIVDLDGNKSIEEGLGLAQIGYRPIPIYNGTNEQIGSMPTVNNHDIEIGLIKGASKLKKMNIEKNAPPVFLLDNNRMNRFKMNVSVFDNSWDIYDQDIPSAEYFIKNDINKIIIRGEKINRDLKKILYKFQKKNIKIFFTNGYETPKEISIKKLSKREEK